MTRAFWTGEIWRWLLAAAAVVVALVGALCFRLLVCVFGPFPEDLVEPTAGFLMGSLVVLAGSLPAPRRRWSTAIILFVAGMPLGTILLNFHFMGTVLGGLAAVGFIAWWFHPHRTERSTFWVGVTAGAVLCGFVGLLYARYVDRPARPDQLPAELHYALGTNASRVAAFYSYDRGGFLDREWLWRIDAHPDVVALVASGLGLQSTNVVPQKFWRMPPHYWLRSMPAGAEAFQSSAFSADARGPDGALYLMVHDRTQERAFVWFKSNF